MENFWDVVGAVAGGVMPLFNIPLIVRIYRRKSADDLSLTWLFGIWTCIALMFPSALRSDGAVLRVFGISNLVFFSALVAVVVYFRRSRAKAARPE